MIPKEKAIELYEKYYYKTPSSIDSNFTDALCTKFTLITVDEIIRVLVELSNGEFTFIYDVEYWQEVRKEINKL